MNFISLLEDDIYFIFIGWYVLKHVIKYIRLLKEMIYIHVFDHLFIAVQGSKDNYKLI